MDFRSFDLDDRLHEGLDAMGFTTPTPIQNQAIPIVREGKDLIACAQTGTGKTAAFLLPMIHSLMNTPRSDDSIGALIIVPTRELAVQIDMQLQGFSYFTSLSSMAIYGGGDGAGFDQQRKALSTGTDIVVATPGKLLSHLNLGYVKLNDLKFLVLDEADRMLDMGFFDDIMRIVRMLPENRQNLMFSATMPSRIRDMAKRILKNPEEISISISKPAAGVQQEAYLAFENQKLQLVEHLMNNNIINGTIIFASTKKSVKEIAFRLRKMKINAGEIHSDLTQIQREEVLRTFRQRQIPILVATDVISRGIDIEDLGMVINFDVPGDPEDYVHRVGRTARAASTGKAVTFINEQEQRKFSRIEQLIGYEIKKNSPPEELGPGPAYNPVKFPGVKKGFRKGKKPGQQNKNRRPPHVKGNPHPSRGGNENK